MSSPNPIGNFARSTDTLGTSSTACTVLVGIEKSCLIAYIPRSVEYTAYMETVYYSYASELSKNTVDYTLPMIDKSAIWANTLTGYDC